jgi:hypothetical protein
MTRLQAYLRRGKDEEEVRGRLKEGLQEFTPKRARKESSLVVRKITARTLVATR